MNFEYIHQTFKNKDFVFSKNQIYNLYVSLKTKPFVILSGISGTGKSKIISIFAEIINGDSHPNANYFELVPVKPNWTDSRGIFGFYNLITDTYEITPTLKLFLHALKNPDMPHFLVLDEMNLAKIEYYFSDFLSLIESRRYHKENTASELTEKLDQLMRMQSSEAAILAGLNLNASEDYVKLSDIRNHRYVQAWKERNYHGEDENWTPMFRTNFNQKNEDGSFKRLAGRVFVDNPLSSGPNRSFCFKDESLLDPETKRELKSLQDLYNDINTLEQKLDVPRKIIVQNLISLHEKNTCIASTGASEWENTESLSQENMYKAHNLIDNDKGVFYIPPKIPIPLNVFVIGTVNIDETTHSFSPKVLDRSNVIEFNEIDILTVYNVPVELNSIVPKLYVEEEVNVVEELPLLDISLASIEDTNWLIANQPEIFKILLSIYEILQKKDRHFGYRVFNEISSYIINYGMYTSNENRYYQALDKQILQKILPKINGSREEVEEILLSILFGLLKISDATIKLEDLKKSLLINSDNINITNIRFRSSIKKLKSMLQTLYRTGFVTFIQ